jgi:hypothetical protein
MRCEVRQKAAALFLKKAKAKAKQKGKRRNNCRADLIKRKNQLTFDDTVGNIAKR